MRSLLLRDAGSESRQCPTSCQACGRSVCRKFLDEGLQPADHGRLSGSSFQCLVSDAQERFDTEACREAFQTHGGDVPVAIATRARKKIDLPRDAFDECGSQFEEQRGIVARGC